MRITARAKSRGVMGDRRVSPKRKGNVLSSCVTPASMNARETMAVTEKQEEMFQVSEKQPGTNNRQS